MLFSMANQQCKAFATCVEGTDGNSRVNELLFSLFAAGQKQIHDGSCKAAHLIYLRGSRRFAKRSAAPVHV